MINDVTKLGSETNLIDVFKEIAWRTGQHYGTSVNFLFGPEDDILKILQIQTKTGTTKYNLLALVLPFTEIQNDTDFDTTVNDFRFLIGCMAGEGLFADRYTANYIGILYPVYKAFLQSIAESGYFTQVFPEMIQHNKIDASNGKPGNVFADFIDFIWIDSLKLNLIG